MNKGVSMYNEEEPMALIPMVIETTGRGERAYDIYSLLLKERIVFLGTPISDQVGNVIVAQLIWLDAQDPERLIRMYINSPGGLIYAGMAIYDTMQQLSAPVQTVAVGVTASFGTVILAAGSPGQRYALPNATIHLHQPHGGTQGQATDIEIQAREILRQREKINTMLAKHTGQLLETIERDVERDFYMDAEGAKAYGLIDNVLAPVVRVDKENGKGLEKVKE